VAAGAGEDGLGFEVIHGARGERSQSGTRP
jgi:hypothetical protein